MWPNSRLNVQMMKFALHVISGAGFGVPFTWEASSDEKWPNHILSFRSAVETVLHHLIAIVLLPKILLKLPFPALRRAELGYNEFGAYMQDLVDRENKLGKDSTRANLIAELLKYAPSEGNEGDQKASLQDQEIIGNMFIFLIAGHETTYPTPHHK